MLLDARLVLALAAFTGLSAVVISIRAGRRERARLSRVRAWPAFVDTVVSALSAGATIDDALIGAAARAPVTLQEIASQFARDIDTKGSALALRQLAKAADNAATDEFSVLLQINRKLGGAGLAELLSSHSSRVRRANAQQLAVATKVTATLAMAKLGVLAPWVLLALLLSRSESATAFNTVGGLGVLLGGLAVSVIAYRLTSMLGRSEEVLRVYSPYGKA